MLYARSRNLLALSAVTVLIVTLISALHTDRLPLVFADGGGSVPLPVVEGLIPAILLGRSFAYSLGAAEVLFRRRFQAVRVVHVLAVASVLLIAALIAGAVAPTSSDKWTFLSNSLGTVAVGVMTVTVTKLPSWSIALPVVAVVYVAGVDPVTGRARRWAWLAWSSSGDRWLVNVGLFLCAGVLFSLTTPVGRADLG